jgi:hypothetical protein
MNTNITLSTLGSITVYSYGSKSQLMTKFLGEWHSALDEVFAVGLVIPEALQVTSLLAFTPTFMVTICYYSK